MKLRGLDNPDFRSGICLSLGGIQRPDQTVKVAWKGTLENWYLQSPDGGTHSAARWALTQWKLALPKIEETKAPTSDRDWWHPQRGLRFVKIPSGNVRSENETIVVPKEFWLSDTEITVGLFQHFIDDGEYTGLKPEEWEGAHVFENDKTPDLPVQKVSWFDSVKFCNWLSTQLGLDPCYELEKMKEELNSNKQYSVKLLATDGIRLPTEAEWEFACRAGTTTRFSFGDDDIELDSYGWIRGRSNSRTRLVAAKHCNAWGLFDMHGNVWEWCWADTGGPIQMYRGGSWNNYAWDCQSSISVRNKPTTRINALGFRVVRSLSNQASPASESGSEGR